MTLSIYTLVANIDIKRPPRRKDTKSDGLVTLEIGHDNCRVWDTVDYTDCGEFYSFADDSVVSQLARKKLIDMAHFSEVFRYLTDQYTANRRNPIGEFLRHAITAMEAALAAKNGTSVYFAQADSRIKIGWSKMPATRVATLQIGNASPIRLLGVIPGGRTKERELHELFAHARLNGEWFEATPALLDFIASTQGDA